MVFFVHYLSLKDISDMYITLLLKELCIVPLGSCLMPGQGCMPGANPILAPLFRDAQDKAHKGALIACLIHSCTIGGMEKSQSA